MAIEKTKLVIDISAKTKDSQKNVKDLSGEVKNLDENQKSLNQTSKKTTEAVEKERKKYEGLAKTLNRNNSQMKIANSALENFGKTSGGSARNTKDLAKSFGRTAEQAKVFNASIAELGDSGVKNLGKLGSTVINVNSAFNTLSNTFNALIEIVQAIAQGYQTFITVLEILADRKRMEGILRLIKLLSFMARWRGFTKTANALDSMGLALLKVSARAEAFRSVIEDQFGRAVFFAEALDTAFIAAKVSGLILVTALAGMTLSGIHFGLYRAAAVTGLWHDQIFKLLPSLKNAERAIASVQTVLISLEKAFTRSTVGAQRVNVLRGLYFSLQYQIEIATNQVLKFGKALKLPEIKIATNLFKPLLDQFKRLPLFLNTARQSFVSIVKAIAPFTPALTITTAAIVDLVSIMSGIPSFFSIAVLVQNMKFQEQANNVNILIDSFKSLGKTIVNVAKSPFLLAMNIFTNGLTDVNKSFMNFFNTVRMAPNFVDLLKNSFVGIFRALKPLGPAMILLTGVFIDLTGALHGTMIAIVSPLAFIESLKFNSHIESLEKIIGSYKLLGKTIADTVVKSFNNLVSSFKTFTHASTAGAQQVGLFQRIFFNLQFSSEELSKILDTKLTNSLRIINGHFQKFLFIGSNAFFAVSDRLKTFIPLFNRMVVGFKNAIPFIIGFSAVMADAAFIITGFPPLVTITSSALMFLGIVATEATKTLKSFFKTSTAGAQQVGFLQRAFLNLQWQLEGMNKSFSNLGQKITNFFTGINNTMGAFFKGFRKGFEEINVIDATRQFKSIEKAVFNFGGKPLKVFAGGIDITKGLMDDLGDSFVKPGNAMKNLLGEMVDEAEDFVDANSKFVRKLERNILVKLRDAFKFGFSEIRKELNISFPKISSKIVSMGEIINNFSKVTVTSFSKIAKNVKLVVPNLTIVSSSLGDLVLLVQSLRMNIQNQTVGISTAFSVMRNDIVEAGDLIKRSLKKSIQLPMGAVRSIIALAKGDVRTFLKAFISGMETLVTPIVAVTSVIRAFFHNIITFPGELKDFWDFFDRFTNRNAKLIKSLTKVGKVALDADKAALRMMNNLFGESTAGAQQVGLLKRAFFELQFAMEKMGGSASKIFKSLISSLKPTSDFVRDLQMRFVVLNAAIQAGFKSSIKTVRQFIRWGGSASDAANLWAENFSEFYTDIVKGSSVGSKQVGLFRRAVLSLQFTLEKMGGAASKVFKSLISSLKPFSKLLQGIQTISIVASSAIVSAFKTTIITMQQTIKWGYTLGQAAHFWGNQFNFLFQRMVVGSSAGAKHVGIFRRAILNLQFSFEKLNITMRDVFSNISRLQTSLFKYIKNTKIAEKATKILADAMVNLQVTIFKLRIDFISLNMFLEKFVKSATETLSKLALGIKAKVIDPITKTLVLFATTIKASSMNAFKGFSEGIKTVGPSFKLFGSFLVQFAIGFKDGFLEPLIQGRLLIANWIPIIKGAARSVKGFSEILTKVFNPSIVTATKAGASFGPLLASLGLTAIASENAFVKLAGVAMFILATAFVTLGTIVTLLLDKIGRLVEAIGDTLINAITKYEEKAKKAQAATKLFEFTIIGFNRVLGEDAVGSLELWNAVISDLSRNTTFATGVIRKAVKLLVAEGSSLNLSVTEMNLLLKRASDIAAVTGKDLDDIITRLIAGIQGQSQAVLALGINLSQHALDHSKLAEQMGITASKADEVEKTQLRLAETFKQTEPIIGAAASSVQTIAGANLQYEKSLGAIQSALGRQSSATVAYTKILTSLSQVFLQLPQPMITLIAVFTDLFGVIFKVVGIFMQYFLLMASLGTIIKLLNGVLAAQGLLATGLDKTFTFLAEKLSVYNATLTSSIAANVSLNVVMMNTVRIVKAAMIATFIEFIRVLSKTKDALIAFNAAMWANPLFIKSASIVVAIFGIVAALNFFNEEIQATLDVMPTWLKVVLGLVLAFKALSLAINSAWVQSQLKTVAITRLIVLTKLYGWQLTKTTGSIAIFAGATKLAALALLKYMKKALIGVTAVVVKLTAALWANPLVWAAALIIGGLVAIGFAVKELKEEFKVITEGMEKSEKVANLLVKELGFLEGAWLAIKDTIIGVGIAFVQFIKIGLIGLIGNIKLLEKAWLQFKNKFAKGKEFEENKKQIQQLEKEIQIWRGLLIESTGKMIDAISGTNIAFGETEQQLKKINKQLNLFNISEITIQRAKIEALGTEFQKLAKRITITKNAFNELRDKAVRGIKLTTEEVTKLKEIQDERLNSSISRTKLERETIGALNQMISSANKDRLKEQGKLVTIAKLEAFERINLIDNMLEGLRTLKVSENELDAIRRRAFKALEGQNKAAIEAAKKQQAEFKYGDQTQQLEELIKSTKELEKANLSFGKSKLKALSDIHKAHRIEIFDLAEKLAETGKLGKKELEILDKRASALRQSMVQEEQKIKIDMSGDIGKVGSDLSGMFSNLGSMMGVEMGGALSSVAKGIMDMVGSTASAIIGLILKAPAIIDAITGLVNEISDWPAKLTESFRGLAESLQNFLMEFPDAMMQMAEDIPVIAERFLIYLIENIDKIAIKWFKLSIEFMPKLAWRFAIAAGKVFVAAMKKAFKAMFQLFNIKIPAVQDIKDATEGMNKTMRLLAATQTGATSELFKVSDLEGQKKASDQAEKLRAGIEEGLNEGGRKTVEMLQRWWDELVRQWRGLWDNVINAWRGFWNGIVEAWRAIWNFVGVIWEGIKNVIKGIIEAASVLWKLLWGAVQKAITEFGNVLSLVGQKIGELVVWLMEAVGKFFDGVVNFGSAIVEFGKTIVSSLAEGALNLVTSLGNSVGTLLTKIKDGILGAFTGGGEAATIKLQEFPTKLVEESQKVVDKFIGIGKEAFGWVDTNIVQPLSTIGEDAFKWVDTNIVKPLTSIGTDFLNLGKDIWTGFNDGLATLGTWFTTQGKAIWTGLQTGLLSLGTWFTTQGKAIWTGLQTGLLSLGTWFSNQGKAIFNGFDSNLDSLVNWFSDLGKKISSAFNLGLDGLGLPNWFENLGTNIASGFLSSLGDLGGGSFVNKVKNALGLAQGGIIPGTASVGGDSPLNDKVLAFVSPGEAVIPRTVMADPILGMLIRRVLDPNFRIPNFQDGGLVTGGLSPLPATSISGVGGMGGPVNVTINFSNEFNIETTQTIDKDFIRDEIGPEIEEIMRRKSLDGKRLIESSGIG